MLFVRKFWHGLHTDNPDADYFASFLIDTGFGGGDLIFTKSIDFYEEDKTTPSALMALMITTESLHELLAEYA
jgi:hypothetical protein